MTKRILYFFLFMAVSKCLPAQQPFIDSLLYASNTTRDDTARLIQLNIIAESFTETNPDSALFYAEKIRLIARELNLRLEEVQSLGKMGYAYINKGNYPRSLQTLLQALAFAEDPESEKNLLPASFPASDEFTDRNVSAHNQRLDRLSRTHQYMGVLYHNTGNYEKALFHYLKAKEYATQTGNTRLLSIINNTLGRLYLSINKKDSALMAAKQAYDEAIGIGLKRYLGSTLLNLGRIYMALGNKQMAAEYLEKAVTASEEQGYFRGVAASNLALADLYGESANKDSVFQHIKNALLIAQDLNAPDLLLRSYTALADHYRDMNSDSTVKYQALIIKINDSLFNSKQTQEFQNIDFDDQQRQQQIEAANAAYRARIRMYLLLGGIVIFLFIAIILWRNSRQRKLANVLLSRQKIELESALNTLKTTQKQLIQSEKMASLGELTAGIAHEIQNPLNFVNNFSEVNSELVDELKKEMLEGRLNEAAVLADDIRQNNEKIAFHGRRADSIVKGMLQHSRGNTGHKEEVDINVMTDEYLRLAYHGMRAKDKSFNVNTITEFDDSIGKINVVPQEIGRVILNLLTNAFYSVSEKKKRNGEEYNPVISVHTKKQDDKIEIRVRDNGIGIPQKVLDKIFQPFFTTKPTGHGTGLGLSLSYDLVTKGHGGEMMVDTKEGEYAEFIIILPT